MGVSFALGIPLYECLRRMTHKELLICKEYLNRQWNKPTKSDHYLMQISQEVKRTQYKNPNLIKLSDFKIPFGFRPVTQDVTPQHPPTGPNSSANIWCSFLGIKKP